MHPLAFDVAFGGPSLAHAELVVTSNSASGFFEAHRVDACAQFSTTNPTTQCAVSSSQTNQAGVSLTVPLLSGDSALVRILASGRADSSVLPIIASFSAVADPYIWIDPTQLIDVNGELIPANQLYTLVGDPEVNFLNIPDPAYVPLPPALWQFGAGLALALARARRRVR
ncbi:MAG: hypothetical protein IT486_11105 [Gammaproteobacteria bacterium]|nr:hypothetical protein [Gammaproteobacteria bacterium]